MTTGRETTGAGYELFHLEHPLADIWVGCDTQDGTEYAYGGTRMVPASMPQDMALALLERLLLDESQLKNRLINLALRDGWVSRYAATLPPGFAESVVGGGRCVIRPRTRQFEAILADPANPSFTSAADSLFRVIGEFLNDTAGRIKLTPDFGRYSSCADILRLHTPHVLGIRCEDGGNGGKSSYTTTGVQAAFEYLRPDPERPVTHIGSAGAIGAPFLDYLVGSGYTDIAISDLVYGGNGGNGSHQLPDGVRVLPADPGVFTSPCLARSGMIIATTWGDELVNSSCSDIGEGTVILLAHNNAVPQGRAGESLMAGLTERGVVAIPGQVLTLGGALSARLEWFWRRAFPGVPYDKPLAHAVIRETVRFWMSQCLDTASAEMASPYQAMLVAAADRPR